MSGDAEVEVVDIPAASRYEARIGSQLAGRIEYRLDGATIDMTHTEVEPAFEGRGVGGRLAAGALADARARGLAVLPNCSFVRSYIERHPELVELVPADARARFGL